MDTPDTTTVDPSHSESWTKFAAWSAEQLGCALSFDGTTYRLVKDHLDEAVGEDQATVSTIRRRWSLRRSKRETPSTDEIQPLLEADSEREVILGLFSLINQKPEPPNLRPSSQPLAVHEITESLFAAYRLDGGKLHVAGCQLEDIPFLRMTTLAESTDYESSTLIHQFFDTSGQQVAEELINDLGLDQSISCEEIPHRVDEKVLSIRNQLVEQVPVGAISLVWARRASGLLRFEFGEESVDTDFQGWVKTLKPPAAICPQTGVETFHLSTTDNGRIIAAEQIAICEVSGKRYPTEELETCAETGKRVAPDLLTTFAFTGERILKSEMRQCDRCKSWVPASRLSRTGCVVCDSAKRTEELPVPPEELFAGYPKLAKQTWLAAEAKDRTILVSDGWFRRRVAIVDNATRKLVYLAEASRFSSVWRPIVNHAYGEEPQPKGEDA